MLTTAGPADPAVARATTRAFSVPSLDVALLAVRVGVGLILAGHGAQKLLGWFGGPGLDGTGAGFASLGYTPGRFFAALAGGSELAGGLLLAAGLFTPLAAAAVIGVMVNAVAVHWSNGVWAAEGGFEYPLLLALVAAAIGFAGPGRFSLDRDRRWGRGGGVLGVFSLALGLSAALVTLAVKVWA